MAEKVQLTLEELGSLLAHAALLGRDAKDTWTDTTSLGIAMSVMLEGNVYDKRIPYGEKGYWNSTGPGRGDD